MVSFEQTFRYPWDIFLSIYFAICPKKYRFPSLNAGR